MSTSEARRLLAITEASTITRVPSRLLAISDTAYTMATLHRQVRDSTAQANARPFRHSLIAPTCVIRLKRQSSVAAAAFSSTGTSSGEVEQDTTPHVLAELQHIGVNTLVRSWPYKSHSKESAALSFCHCAGRCSCSSGTAGGVSSSSSGAAASPTCTCVWPCFGEA
jgi:hypothetical protein